MRYLPLSDDDRQQMLAAIGASSIDDLFVDVPEAARLGGKIAGLPDHASELSVERQLSSLAARCPTSRPGSSRPAARSRS